MDGLHVIKRDGTEEKIDLSMIHDAVEWACEGYDNVSVSDIEINSKLQFYEGITTSEIQKVMIRSAADLISKEKPNYQHVAAKLLLMDLRKQVYKQLNPIPFEYLIKNNIYRGIYDKILLKKYTNQEIVYFSKKIDYDRDYQFTYAGLSQMVDKYLLQDRMSGELYETPQEAFMLIGMFMFMNYDKKRRRDYVVKLYNALSLFKISLPTPIMAGVRTPLRQFSSCCLIDVGDSIESIMNSNTAVGYYTSQRAGIGLNFGRIRGIDAQIRGGEVIHTGLVPFLKMYEATTKSFTQNSIRGGGSTSTIPFFHWEIETFIQLKNNKGNDENRVRRMDYSVALNRLFRTRVKEKKTITLFSSEETRDLYDLFYSSDYEQFETTYLRYEKDPHVRKKIIDAREFYLALLKERYETGRIYILNADHVNKHSSFKDSIYMSNLCQEITLPTTPLEDINLDKGEIAMCILSNINLGKVEEIEELDELTELLVRFLDELIDYQEYPVKVAEKSTKGRRSLGIGVSDVFNFLAKNNLRFNQKEGIKTVHRYMERFQYGLIKASADLAKEKGRCKYFANTKYADNIFPIDTYEKNVDEIVPNQLLCDWDELRDYVKKFGLRNSALSAIPPAASSSIVSNSTAGIDPVRRLLIAKMSKYGPLKQLVPGFDTYKDNYPLAWDMDNESYIKFVSIFQKFIDQSISTNLYYNTASYKDNRVPMRELVKHENMAYKYGLKTLYYLNSNDNSGEESQLLAQKGQHEPDVPTQNMTDGDEMDGCEGGACSV
ncbi:MAG: ribonucleoside-diphosphate reductase subunit alpha [Acidobacteria bacterium]|nr:MAG: ribonucleoside-diphosphate reductase subunit alpha [Acidobacteriota bacterium]PIE91087.1 MAG: ribonucleoside-diphosphate reductase subunit alpha [Acidobacteriota bacterium]